MATQVYMSTNYGGTTINDRRWRPVDQAAVIPTAEFAATQDLRTLDTYLATANATYWTTKRLNEENWWDKLFWLRSQVAVGAVPQ